MGSFAGGKGSWLTFARAGYMGLVYQFIDQADLPKPQYGDGFAKLTYDFSSKQKLSVEFLTALDKYVYNIPATTGSWTRSIPASRPTTTSPTPTSGARSTRR
jgi:hypothetical protein